MQTLAASWMLNLYTTEVWRFHVKMEKSGTNKGNSSQLHSFTSWLSPFSFSMTQKNSLRGGLIVLWALFPKNVGAPGRLQENWGGYKSFRNSKEFAVCLISLIKAGSWGTAVLSETSTGRGPKAMIPVRFGDYSGYCPASQFWWSCCQSSQSSMFIQNAFLVQFTLRGVRKQISAISPVEQNSRKEARKQPELPMTAQRVHQIQLRITRALNTWKKTTKTPLPAGYFASSVKGLEYIL